MTHGTKMIAAGLTVGAGVAAAAWALVVIAPPPATTGGARRIVVVPGGTAAGAFVAARARAAGTASATFTASDVDFANPERGFYRWAWDSTLDRLSADDAADAYANNYRLMFVLLRLDAYRDGDIPATYIANLQRGFDAARGAGIKLIVRAVYNYPENETQYANAKDATLARVKAHVGRLKPLLQKNADVIAFMQAGFVGAWGEWHTSSNNLTTPTNRTQVKDALLDAVPTTRFVQFRYPAHLQSWSPTLPSIDAALGGSFRLGFHNDCFLASQTDVGTYDEDATVRAGQRDHMAKLTELAPFGGETCNPADEEGAVSRTTCADIKGEGARYHLTYLNQEYYRTAFHDRWTRDGCMAEVRRRTGYRFELTRVSHADALARGGAFQVALGLRNGGWARLYNPRPFQIVLRSASGTVRRIAASGTDPRRWLPSTSTADLRATATIPADLAPGTYSVLLALPDATLTDPRFAIRFANADVGGQGWRADVGAFATGTTVRIN